MPHVWKTAIHLLPTSAIYKNCVIAIDTQGSRLFQLILTFANNKDEPTLRCELMNLMISRASDVRISCGVKSYAVRKVNWSCGFPCSPKSERMCSLDWRHECSGCSYPPQRSAHWSGQLLHLDHGVWGSPFLCVKLIGETCHWAAYDVSKTTVQRSKTTGRCLKACKTRF